MVYILHISDLHFVKNSASYNTEEILLREAKEKVKNVPQGQKMLIVTGDFHNFWEEDYKKAELFIKKLVSMMGLNKEQDVFVVPGNHDVGNDSVLEPLLSAKDKDWKTHRDDCLNKLKNEDMSYIEKRLQVFRPYCAFVRRLGIYENTLDINLPVRSHVRNWRGKLNILHLNTALLADGSPKIDLIADADTAASSEIWEKYYDNKIPSLAIAHNNFFDLKQEQRKDLATTFNLKNVSAYLCGDRHRTEHDFEHQWIRITGGYRSGDMIPNIVAAKSIADGKDTYSEVGFCWHYWDEESDGVTVEFRKWTRDSIAKTDQDGEMGEYVMRHEANDISKPFDNIGPSIGKKDTLNLSGNDTRLYESNNRDEKYKKKMDAVDIVFCIDGTASMNTLQAIKGQAVHFYQDVRYQLEKRKYYIGQIRARIILFRDFIADGKDALMTTTFFDLPEETSDFDRIMNNIETYGGGDEEEDGLEALGVAIRSKWNLLGKRRRQIILLWTDAVPHNIGYGKDSELYPEEMAHSFEELTQWWMNEELISQNSKRLLLFAPYISWWERIISTWDRVIGYPVENAEEIKSIDYEGILSAIVNSI